MITGAVKKRAACIVGEVSNLKNVILKWLERFQRTWHFLELAFIGRVPGVHDHAVWHIEEGHADRRAPWYGAGGESWTHGIEEGKPDGGATDSSQECTSG